MYDKNLYAYCDNNPVMRKDEDGEFWSVVGAIGAQYVGDVIANIADGATGADIFSFRSTAGEYIAAGVTALMPGSRVVSILAQNVVAEAILSVERHVSGKRNNLRTSVSNVVKGTIADSIVNIPTSKVTKYVKNKTDKTYSQYAKNVYRKNPNVSRQTIQAQAQKSTKWGRRIANGIDVVVGFLHNLWKR